MNTEAALDANSAVLAQRNFPNYRNKLWRNTTGFGSSLYVYFIARRGICYLCRLGFIWCI